MVASFPWIRRYPHFGFSLPAEGPGARCPLAVPVVPTVGASRSIAAAPDLDAAEQGLGLDEEAPATSGREHPTQSGEHCAVRRSKYRTCHLAAQHGDLVAKHDDLDGQLILSTPREPD